MFRIVRLITRISSYILCCTGSLAVVLSLWRRDRNRMDSEENDTLGGTDPHHSSGQCKESHCCYHGSLAPLALGDSGTSNVLTRYESMWLRSVRQSERTTARDPVQHKRWTHPCYRAVKRNINKDGRADGVRRLPNIWKKVINKGGDYVKGT